MNSQIREELTVLLADHLNECQVKRIIEGDGYPMEIGLVHKIAEDAMDFIYGEPDGDVQKPEQPQVVTTGHAWFGDQGGACGTPCGCGQSECSWPGDVDRLEGGPVGPNVVYGVVTPSEVLRESFVYLGPLSRTEEYVPAPRSGYGPKVQ